MTWERLAGKMTSDQEEPGPTPEGRPERRGGQPDNGRLHLPGPVHRPRPHLRPHLPAAGSPWIRRPTQRPGGLPHPPLRPGQPVRARAGRPAVPVRQRRHPHAAGRALCRGTPSTPRPARSPSRALMAGRSSAIHGTTRTVSWRSCTPPSCGSTTRSPTTSEKTEQQKTDGHLRRGPQPGPVALPVDAGHRLPAYRRQRRDLPEHLRRPASDPTPRLPELLEAAASSSCPWSFPWPPSGSGTP